jgi:hypothetical protein
LTSNAFRIAEGSRAPKGSAFATSFGDLGILSLVGD